MECLIDLGDDTVNGQIACFTERYIGDFPIKTFSEEFFMLRQSFFKCFNARFEKAVAGFYGLIKGYLNTLTVTNQNPCIIPGAERGMGMLACSWYSHKEGSCEIINGVF